MKENQPSSFDKTLTDLLKLKLLKTPENSTHASQFTKHLIPLTLEGGILIQLHLWWDIIISSYCKYLSTSNFLPT